MNDNKIIIDPDQFAAAIIAGNPKQTNEDNKVYIKRQLTLYLESVLLANDFNIGRKPIRLSQRKATPSDFGKNYRTSLSLECVIKRDNPRVVLDESMFTMKKLSKGI